MTRRATVAISALALVLAFGGSGQAQEDYPSGQMAIVVGFSPGGTDDTGARAVAPLISDRLGVPVIVDSRPGAGMQVALEHTWAQPHDGHTLLWNNQQYLSTIEVADPEIPYKTSEWTWLEVLQNDPTVIVVQASAPWQSLQELIDDMRARPNEITVGLLTGSVQQLACKRLFEGLLDLSFREVPQQSGGPMRASLVGGHLEAICTNSSETYNLGPDVRALAIFSNQRSRLLPDAIEVNKVLAENGISETIPEAGALRGIAVPRDFAEENPEAFAKLYEAYRGAVDSDEYHAWLKETGRDAVTQSMSMEESNEAIASYNQFFLDNKDIILGE